MPDVVLGSVPAKAAIENIRSKLRVPSKRWDAMMGEAHAKAFTIAGAMKAELLADFHESLTEIAEKGGSLQDFRRDFDKIVAKHGWEYKGSRGWRSHLIYSTNMRTANMAGRWKQIQRTKNSRPYLVYMTVGDSRVRDEHRNWHNTVLPVDHPWWDTHFPPNGWGCRCYVNTLSDRQRERQGLEVSQAPVIKNTERYNTLTGESYGTAPEGIDTGWDYNPGKAWLGTDVAFGQRLMTLPRHIRQAALANNRDHIEQLNKSWGSWLKEREGQRPSGYAHTVGYLGDDVISALEQREIEPIGAAIVVFDKQLDHLSGGHKSEKKRVPSEWILNLPVNLRGYSAILLHKNDLVFVFDQSAAEKNYKAIVQVNFKRKGQAFNSVRSLGVVNKNDLNKRGYELLLGDL